MENITLLLFYDLQILVSPLHDITLPLYLLVDSVTGFLNAFIKKFIMLPVETSQVIPTESILDILGSFGIFTYTYQSLDPLFTPKSC